jgi:hypothetical protein
VWFRSGVISEAELFKKFFTDGREFDGRALRQTMVDSYYFIEGIEDLLTRLKASGVEMHALSNYPTWHK